MTKSSLILAVAAGLLGGFAATQFPTVVHAETANEIRAHKFVLLNHAGEIVGTFALDPSERPVIRLYEHGQEVWNAGGSPMHPLTMK